MYQIIFSKKKTHDNQIVKNVLYNLQYFIVQCSQINKNFINLLQEYINYLETEKVELNYDDLIKYEQCGIILSNNPKIINKYTINEYKESNKILIYTGFSGIEWNYTYGENNALGGSETAVNCLIKEFPKSYDIYIAGSVKEETIDNIKYINLETLKTLNVPFHTVIVSRYLGFYEMFPNISFGKSFIWAHDIVLNTYGSNLNVDEMLKKWSSRIDGCICLTNWHRNLFLTKYPILKDKLDDIINNGIITELFKYPCNNKTANKFIYSSCTERGLEKILDLWSDIIIRIPNATLVISTYNPFPRDDKEEKIKEKIDTYPSITHLGKLTKSELYEEMSSSEYWLYPTNWPETSCITAMEMLMSEVICVYYPIAGLVDTINNNGIQIKDGNEIESIMKLTTEEKTNIRQKGKEYALSCSWADRAKIWDKLIVSSYETQNKKNIAIFNSFNFHYEMFGYIIHLCKTSNYTLTIFTNINNNMGWLELYKKYVPNFDITYIDFKEFSKYKDKYDLVFVTTDDDPLFDNTLITNKYICIDHNYIVRRPQFKDTRIATRPFCENLRDWVIPCFPLLKISDKSIDETIINIAIIGSLGIYDILNRLESNNAIKLHIIGRHVSSFQVQNIKTHNVNIYNNLDAIEMIELLKKCDYVLTDSTDNCNHRTGKSMSGNIPLAYSTLTPLIIDKYNNSLYKFKNVVEFDYCSTDKININKSMIDLNLLDAEREELVSMLPEWLNKKDLLDYNIFYFEHDDVYVRLLQNEKDKKIYQNFSNRSNAEIMFRKLINYIMPNFIDKNIIDLGAYIGDNAVPWALKTKGLIYAIDPSPENISFIKKMAIINNVNNIVTIEKAISDKTETIYYNETETTHISCNNSNGRNSFNAVSLDSLNLENVGFIHLDVEGFEQKVLDGAIELINKYKPIICWEQHLTQDDYKSTVIFLTSIGYNSYIINEQFPHCFPDCRNLISFPNNSNNNIIPEITNKFQDIYKKFTPDKERPFLINLNNKIPKKIFQTWEHNNIEPEFQKIIDIWKNNNPDYEYIFHDAEQRFKFIKDNFDEKILSVYDKIIPGAYKCDLWRYCVLYIHGGFYADIDTLCMGNLNAIIDPNNEFIVPIDLNVNPKEGQHNLACGFIGSVSKSPILLDAINKIVFNVENNNIPTSKLDLTGPGLLGRAVNTYLNLEETNSFIGKEGVVGNIKFLLFDRYTEYMRDVNSNVNILQNKNKNQQIIQLYNNECMKLKSYVSWTSSNKILKVKGVDF